LVDISFTQAPDKESGFQVGDQVEVFCDHEDAKDNRVRDWLEGVVVQVDPKIVAVQFSQKVYLTDGWMVPDHVLWCPHKSTNIRPARTRKRRPRV